MTREEEIKKAPKELTIVDDMSRKKTMTFPQSRYYNERYVKVRAKLKTWTVVEDVIDFDTYTQSFIIPSGYQVDTKVISWEYYKD